LRSTGEYVADPVVKPPRTGGRRDRLRGVFFVMKRTKWGGRRGWKVFLSSRGRRKVYARETKMCKEGPEVFPNVS